MFPWLAVHSASRCLGVFLLYFLFPLLPLFRPLGSAPSPDFYFCSIVPPLPFCFTVGIRFLHFLGTARRVERLVVPTRAAPLFHRGGAGFLVRPPFWDLRVAEFNRISLLRVPLWAILSLWLPLKGVPQCWDRFLGLLEARFRPGPVLIPRAPLSHVQLHRLLATPPNIIIIIQLRFINLELTYLVLNSRFELLFSSIYK
ncbi:hypothetical protein NDU88_004930 [Pleurodeles waltl]|uniref:Uncharacterized protein n=1 Tax=Pleurodeles waltl TaxID=8319 RepID=A0AAV7VKI1_PLEWA|nr:hypothetical protein NDU88_004930 [Pleurodeles waltl]